MCSSDLRSPSVGTEPTPPGPTIRKFRRRSRHHRVGLGRLGLQGGQVRERRSWQQQLDGRRGRGAGPLAQGPSRSRSPAWAPVAGHWVGSVPTDGERECWPSLVQGE